MNLWLCDRQFRVVRVLYDELTIDASKFIGGTDYDWMSREEADRVGALKRRALETQTPVQAIMSLTWGGEVRDFDLVFAPNFDERGQPQGLLCYASDITDRLRWLRSAQSPETSETLRRAEERLPPLQLELEVDREVHSLKGPSAEVRLTRTEWQLLSHMLDNTGRVMPHEELLDRVWGESYRAEHRLLHDTVSRLRRRFQTVGISFDPIETVHGVGYRLVDGSR